VSPLENTAVRLPCPETFRLARGAALAATLAVGAALPAAADGWTLYDDFRRSYTVPYLDGPNFGTPKEAAIFVSASVGGGPAASFQVDTGSQGMVVPAHEVPGYRPTGPKGRMVYTTTGITLHGHWTDLEVRFPESFDGSGRRDVVRSRLPVLVAEKECTPGRGCRTGQEVNTHMIGVGFGRPDDGAPASYRPSLVNNAFLQVREMQAGSMRRGYVITGAGIELGLTRRNTAGPFAFVKLVRMQAPTEVSPNWETMPGRLVVGTKRSSMGTVLMDTGIRGLIASGPNLGDAPQPGTRVSLELFGARDIAGFSFETGGRPRRGTPADETWTSSDAAPFVNTGINPLAKFVYLFDAEAGFLGLKLKPNATGGFVNPALSLAGRLELDRPLAISLPSFLRDGFTLSGEERATFAGRLSGPGRLELRARRVELTADSHLPGGVVVAAGTFVLKARLEGPVTVRRGATFINRGKVVGAVTRE
jgi:hypothetical protein